LHFTEAPIEFTKPLQDQEVKKIPGRATFECEVTKPDVEVEWFKAGVQLERSSKYKMETISKTQRLVISDVSDEDDDDYVCKIKGKDTKTSAALIVEGKLCL
jgi:hypothetical protein